MTVASFVLAIAEKGQMEITATRRHKKHFLRLQQKIDLKNPIKRHNIPLLIKIQGEFG
jgi:hypothetical protein